MVDLHMHTTHSDGSLTVAELLKRAQEKGLSIISITDHNTVDAYKDLEKKSVRDLFHGRIINGIEITAQVNGCLMEILGFGIDLKQMAKCVKGYMQSCDFQDFVKTETLKKLKELGFYRECYEKMSTVDALGEMCRDKALCDFLGDLKLYNNRPGYIYRTQLVNIKSPLFCDARSVMKSAEEVVETIHKCGGAAFLAHPAEYHDNSDMILEHVKSFIDGIECFHPSADEDMRLKLCKFCLKHKLLICGGSDFHGTPKPDIELGVGRGDLRVPKELLTWL
jgi:predicted metal-dependent phosphoesterase TrpH